MTITHTRTRDEAERRFWAANQHTNTIY